MGEMPESNAPLAEGQTPPTAIRICRTAIVPMWAATDADSVSWPAPTVRKLAALASTFRVYAADLPGQPGLSAANRRDDEQSAYTVLVRRRQVDAQRLLNYAPELLVDEEVQLTVDMAACLT